MTQKSKCLSRNRELLATDYRTRRTDEFLQMLGFARAEPRNDGDNTLVPEACFVVPPRSGARPTEVVVFAFVRLLGGQRQHLDVRLSREEKPRSLLVS